MKPISLDRVLIQKHSYLKPTQTRRWPANHRQRRRWRPGDRTGPLRHRKDALLRLNAIVSLLNKGFERYTLMFPCQGDPAPVASLLPSPAHRTLLHLTAADAPWPMNSSSVFQAPIFDKNKKQKIYINIIYWLFICFKFKDISYKWHSM